MTITIPDSIAVVLIMMFAAIGVFTVGKWGGAMIAMGAEWLKDQIQKKL